MGDTAAIHHHIAIMDIPILRTAVTIVVMDIPILLMGVSGVYYMD